MKLRAGVDVVYYGSQRQLEHDFIVAPGADDLGFGIAVDRKGNAYVTGLTFSTDFPGTSTSTVQPTVGGRHFRRVRNQDIR